MVTEFNGFDKGVIGKKLPSDTTLNNMKKADLIELLHIAEYNHNTLAWFYKNVCDNSKCNRCPISSSRNKAIDEFAEKLKDSLAHNYRHLLNVDTDGFEWITTDSVRTHIDEIAEQMKGE